MKNQNRVPQTVNQDPANVQSQKEKLGPQLEPGALCILGKLIEKTADLTFEDAVATFNCIADLVQHHPALQKEVAGIRSMFECSQMLVTLANAAAEQ